MSIRFVRRVPSHPPPAALRLRRSQHGQGEGSRRRGGHHRPRHGQPGQPDTGAYRGQTDRDGAGPAVAPLFRQQGDSRAAAGAGDILPAPLRCRAGPGNRGGGDAGVEGGFGEFGLGDHQPGRHDPGAEPVLSDPSVRLHHRRRGGAQHSGTAGRGHAAGAGPRGAALGAEADGADRQFPVQSDRVSGRSGFLQGDRRVRPQARDLDDVRSGLCGDLFRRQRAAVDPAGAGGEGHRGGVHQRCRRPTRCRAGGWGSRPAIRG